MAAEEAPIELTMNEDEMADMPPAAASIMENIGDQEEAVAAAAVGATEDEDTANADPMLFLELGDRVLIDSARFGRTVGRIYYRDAELLRLMPDGVSDRLYDFERIYNEETGEDRFDDDLGVTASYVLQKAATASFVEQQDFHVGQELEAITEDGERQDNLYTITALSTTDDSITVVDSTDAEETIIFGFVGIPRDAPFTILRIHRQAPEVALAEAAADGAAPATIAASPVTDEAALDDEAVIEAATSAAEAEELELEIAGYDMLPKTDIYKEVAATEKVFSDTVQKVDALNDFISMLDPLAQKDSRALRAVRVLVETIFNLKQETIEYNMDGTVKGIRPASATMLADLLNRTHVPLSRPVIEAQRRLYYVEKDEIEPENTNEVRMVDFWEEYTASNTMVPTVVSGSGAQYWQNVQAHFAKFDMPWAGTHDREPIFRAHTDGEFFREEAPTIEGDPTLQGYVAGPLLDVVNFSIMRALGRTVRKTSDKRTATLFPADESAIVSYMLFPQSTAAYLGTKRSGKLYIDSARSETSRRSMKEILTSLGGVEEVGVNSILNLDLVGSQLANIPVVDYIDGLNLPSLGLGDLYEPLEELGLNKLELSPDLMTALVSKITAYQDQLRGTLARFREVIASSQPVEPVTAPLLENPAVLDRIIRSEPILVDAIEDFEASNPSLKASDVALTAWLLARFNDYFQAAMGQGEGQTLLVAKERLRATRDRFLAALTVNNLLKKKRAEAGHAPRPNKCEHVAQLRTIRKMPDDSERFQLLTKFFAKYQGEREDNFINCNICKQHLICIHERLQIQGYLNPKENPNLQKELYLNFSGGQFQGNYICRNCGQSIQEIPLETGMEFDDEGRPMMGRATLVDKDAIAQDDLERALTIRVRPPVEEDEMINLTTDEKLYKDTIKEIAATAGVSIDSTAYRRIIKRIKSHLSTTLPNRDVYSKLMKTQKKMPDYDVMRANNIVAAAAVFFLIEMQTAIQSYYIQYPRIGCGTATFDGYPVGTATDVRGMTYVACVVASIMSKTEPWSTTSFQKTSEKDARQKDVLAFMDSILGNVLKTNAAVQEDIRIKRIHVAEMMASKKTAGRHEESIPSGFLPEMIVLKAEEAADGENTIVEEVVNRMGAAGRYQSAKLWIRKAHQMALRTATLVFGSPLSLTSCCLADISVPGTFWSSASDMPALEVRTLRPNFRTTALQVHFVARPQKDISVDQTDELNYRLFLKVCYDGEQKGQPHEFGLTNQCRWCGFQLPAHPATIDVNKEGKLALESQGISAGTDEFEQLLDIIHESNSVEPYQAPALPRTDGVYAEFADMTPPPFGSWKTVMDATFAELNQLEGAIRETDLVNALGELSDVIAVAEADVKQRIPAQAHGVLDGITDLSWDNFMQSIFTYFLVPSSRILQEFDADSFVVPANYKLGDEHIEDIKKIFTEDTRLVVKFSPDFKQTFMALAREKLAYFVKQLEAIIAFKEKMRPSLVPGRKYTLEYIQRALFYGPLYELCNPNRLPPTMEGQAAVDTPTNVIKLLLAFIVGSLSKYNKERLSFNDEQLRELIMVRNEKEKNEFISYLDKMTDEERAVELTNKRLGIGRWAIGGTKLIWAYNADQYERERDERERAGIISFPGEGPNDVPTFDGRPLDDMGFALYQGEGDGYDMRQRADEDNE